VEHAFVWKNTRVPPTEQSRPIRGKSLQNFWNKKKQPMYLQGQVHADGRQVAFQGSQKENETQRVDEHEPYILTCLNAAQMMLNWSKKTRNWNCLALARVRRFRGSL
jgi:hypothetical protein